jgi:DNA polymerase III subunit gamma/tau
MSSEVLYRKWRPQTLGEVVGQEAVTTTLLNAVRTERVGHAYLFCGPRGTGKTSTGRILAKAVNCLNSQGGEPCNACDVCLSISEGRCLDIVEIDAASNRGVDDIRSLRERVNYAAGTVRRKVYIVDEVHMLTDVASNALLKTLEEPPPHVMFVLATTEFHKVLPTIVSRCQSFHFRRLTLNAISEKLRLVCEREDVDADDEALIAISRAAGGSLRDAENVLQQLIASRGRLLRPDDVRVALGVGDETSVLRTVAGLVSRDLTGGLRVLHAVSDEGIDVRNFGRQVVSALRDVMLVQSGCEDLIDGGAERLQELRGVAGEATTAEIARAARRFSEATARDVSNPLLALELAYVDCVVGRSIDDSDAERRERGTSARRDIGESGAASSQGTTHASRQGRTVPRRGAPPEDAGVSAGDRPVVSNQPGTADIKDQGLEGAPLESATGLEAPVHSDESFRPVRTDEDRQLGAQPPEAAPGEPQDELGRVRASWKEFVDSLRGVGSTGNVDAFLRSACEPGALEDDRLVLRFAFEFHKSKIEDPKYRHVVEERLEQFYGRAFKVSCVLDAADGAAAPVSPAPPVTERTPERLTDVAARLGARPKKQG